MGDKVVQFGNWNDELRRGLVNFATSHPDATVMMFSAWDTFTRILSDPARYGFNPADRTTLGGSIWFDFMHPTSRVHDILAGEIAQFLASQPPLSPSFQRFLSSFLAFLTRHKSKREKVEREMESGG